MAGTYAWHPPAHMSNNVSPVSVSDSEFPDHHHGGQRPDHRGVRNSAQRRFRRQIVFSDMAVWRPTRQSQFGATVTLNVVGDLDDDPATATLDQMYDVLPTPLSSGRTPWRWPSTAASSPRPPWPVVSRWSRSTRSPPSVSAATWVPPTSASRTTRGRSGGITNTVVRVARSPTSPWPTPPPTRCGLPRSRSRRTTSSPTPTVCTGRTSPWAQTALRKEAHAAGRRYWGQRRAHWQHRRGYVGPYEGFDIYVSNLVGSGLGGVFVGDEALAKIVL